ncbi:hypothetical protein LTS18_010414, partial [Coniosporium uncinatum]
MSSFLDPGIKFSELPKTFADAVMVAWKFDIRYLWVDCLCIIQDSKEDWRLESMKMGLVYKNSWLNIAAIDSPDCEGGLFVDRDRHLVDPFKITVP